MTVVNTSPGGPVIKTGTASPSGNGVLTSFAFAHGLGAIPSFVSVIAGNALSTALFNAAADVTNVTVTYLVAPLAGSLSLKWMVVA